MQNPPKVIAAIFALCGFAMALACGILAGNPGINTLLNAIVALVVCHVVGVLAGLVLVRVGENQIAAHKAAHPVPEVMSLALRKREGEGGAGKKTPDHREKL
ncbi:MAG: hypothetical protein IPM33_10130 [Phycisphaerales bacterium]|nr:hypothetical protein [Phycisphaerales bacterium]